MEQVIVATYFVILTILAFYGIHRFALIYLYYKHSNNIPKIKEKFEELPPVTIQLPIFNEVYVVERLIDNIMKIKYPKDKFQVQVLDDSTDDTVIVAEKKVEEYKELGYNIQYIHRINRQGFKAGALEESLSQATGEFIAIFDADFLPKEDFLEKIIHYFTDEKVAVVQARWEHINRHFSLMTEVQSILLDGHFILEHAARNRSGRYFNFNGTAGMWRKTAIIDGGGWQHDTLTEDLDLSLRTQLKGWKFLFVQDVEAPAELPIEVNAFKSQQHRWAKGAIQTCRKLLLKILKSPVAFKIKVEAFLQLTNNIAYVLMFCFAALLVPAMVYRTSRGWHSMLFVDLPLFIFATISIATFYSVSQREIFKGKFLSRLKYLPFVTALGIGLCVNNSKAVLEAIFGVKSGFVRTPKYNVKSKKEKNRKYKVANNILPYIELILGINFTIGMYVAYLLGLYGVMPFIFLFQFGFFYMSFLSFGQMLFPAKLSEPHHVEDGKEFFKYPIEQKA